MVAEERRTEAGVFFLPTEGQVWIAKADTPLGEGDWLKMDRQTVVSLHREFGDWLKNNPAEEKK